MELGIVGIKLCNFFQGISIRIVQVYRPLCCLNSNWQNCPVQWDRALVDMCQMHVLAWVVAFHKHV